MKLAAGILILLTGAFLGCSDSTGTKGTITIALTDSPADAAQVQSVNLFITQVDARRGNEWRSLTSFSQPIGVDLLKYSGGKSLPVVDQFLDPGSFTAIRFRLNLADPAASLVHNPQCNVGLASGSTRPIYYFDAGTTDMIITKDFGVATRGHTDITFDIDVRKSLALDDQGNYIFTPVVRMIETSKAGHISAALSNHSASDKIVVYAYAAGQYNSSEASTVPLPFMNAITSGAAGTSQVSIGFLEKGAYDLVFVKVSDSGAVVNVMGTVSGVTVTAGQTASISIDLSTITHS